MEIVDSFQQVKSSHFMLIMCIGAGNEFFGSVSADSGLFGLILFPNISS